MRRCTGAPRCLFRLPASVFESDPLIYPATLFWRRFGCTGLVGGFSFSAKFICMGKWGVGTGFDSRPYKKCAHFAHFAGNLCRVTRTPRAQGHQPQGHQPQGHPGRRDGRGARGARGAEGGRPTLQGAPRLDLPGTQPRPTLRPSKRTAAPPRASGHGALSFGGPAGPVFNVHTEGRAERSVSWPRCGFLLKMGQEGNVHHTQQPTNSGPSRPASHHSPGIRPEGSLRCLPASLSSSSLSTHPGDAWGLRRSVTRLAVSCRVGEINQTVPTLHRTNRRRAAAGYVELIKVTLPCIEYLQGS